MLFEEILPALRAGKKVRRPGWNKSSYVKAYDVMVRWDDGQDLAISVSGLNADDWEVVFEPTRVADYLVKTEFTNCEDAPLWIQRTFEVGKQPTDAMLIPETEREVI